MKQYFIHIQEQEGPFSFEQLKEKSVKRDTPVWFEGLAGWQLAGELDELKELFGAAPPPFVKREAAPAATPPPVPNDAGKRETQEKRTKAEKPENYRSEREKKHYLPWALGILGVIIISVVIYYKTVVPTQQRNAALESFRDNPGLYISAAHNGFKFNKLLGGIWDLKLTIANNSDFAVDNVRCIVTYIRKNGETYKEEFVESGHISPHGNVVIDAPKSDAGMDVAVKVYKVNSSEAGVY